MFKDKGDLKIRFATVNDFENCLPLFELLYHGDIGPNFRDAFNGFIRGKNGCVLLAEKSGKVFGVLVGSYHLDIDWEGKIGKIDALVVREGSRKKGIGTRLVRFFLSKAKKDGCNAITSRVNRKNEKACRFHEKLGFEEAGTHEYILEL